MLTLERAKELLHTTTTEEHLYLHAMKAYADELQIGPK